MGEPSESNKRFVSAVTWLLHFAHLKQSTWKKDWLIEGKGVIGEAGRRI